MTADSPDLDRLDALARAATEGPWAHTDATWDRETDRQNYTENVTVAAWDVATCAGGPVEHAADRREQASTDAEFIAVTDPPTVLALIAELRHMQGERDAALETGGSLAITLLEVIGQRDAALAKVAAVRQLADEWRDLGLGGPRTDALRAAITDTTSTSTTDQEDTHP